MLAEKPLFGCQGLIQPQDMDMYIAKAFKLIRGMEKKDYCVGKGIQLRNRKEIEIIKISGFDLLLKFDFLNPWGFFHIYEHNLAFSCGI